VDHPTVDLLGFLTLGLLSGLGHCAGMCAPFVLFWYTAGRIATYAGFGALAGAFGSAVTTAGSLLGVRRGAALVAGALLVAWAVVTLSDLPLLRGRGAGFARMLTPRVPGHPFAMGLLLGLLPCGMVYSAVVASIALGSALWGAAALALFGLGTAPALLGLSLADTFLVARRALLNRLSQVFILVMGAWFLWRGLL
jgi:sulfite exporter TauE/SafE